MSKVLNKELKNQIGGKIGVYSWVHIPTGKRYVGSSAYDLYDRWRYFDGVLRGRKYNGYRVELIEFLLTTTYDEWKFEVLEIYEKGSVDKHFLEERERHYIIEYNTIENGLNERLPLNRSESGKLAQRKYDSKHRDKLNSSSKKYNAKRREISASRNKEGGQS